MEAGMGKSRRLFAPPWDPWSKDLPEASCESRALGARDTSSVASGPRLLGAG